jgi:hypothetical protein
VAVQGQTHKAVDQGTSAQWDTPVETVHSDRVVAAGTAPEGHAASTATARRIGSPADAGIEDRGPFAGHVVLRRGIVRGVIAG